MQWTSLFFTFRIVIAKLMANPAAVTLSTEFTKGKRVHFDTAVITCDRDLCDTAHITCGLGPLAKYPGTIVLLRPVRQEKHLGDLPKTQS
jgi:hypothetical protein